ncbi:hypothetical protein BSZ35_11705 [Salinibacter sp. 10B]|nr:hypothetical protein BSZ35_11705 [Salinibacter sp. 10B]
MSPFLLVRMCIFGRIQKCTKKIAAVKKMPDLYFGHAEILRISLLTICDCLAQTAKNFQGALPPRGPGGILFHESLRSSLQGRKSLSFPGVP